MERLTDESGFLSRPERRRTGRRRRHDPVIAMFGEIRVIRWGQRAAHCAGESQHQQNTNQW